VIRTIAVTILLATSALLPFAKAQEASTDSSRPVVEKISPVYPQIARSGNLPGTVKLRVTVAPDGKVQEVEVVGGSPAFVQASSASVANGGGQRVPKKVKFSFRLISLAPTSS
jgi:TonB family protein